MFGNLLIVTTLIFYGFIVNLLQKPAPTGDYSVGYAFVWMISVGGFIVSTGLLTWNLNLNHCFDWVPAYRNWLLFFGWITFVMTIIWTLDYHAKWIEGEFPPFMRWFARGNVCYWLPPLMLLPAGYLLNAQRQAGFAPYWIKILLIAGFFVSVLIGLGIFYGLAKASVQRRITLYQAAQKNAGSDESWAYTSAMEAINRYSDTTIQGLLAYTHREKDIRLRDAAVAKIKANENWETQLIQTLEQGELHEVYWVYAFLDGNSVDHPQAFTQPIVHSLGRLTPGAEASLKDPESLNMGYVNIEALCRVLDTQFKAHAGKFRPEMARLQKVFEAPVPERKDKSSKKWFDDTLQASRLALKNWLESNQ